jgi:hypothetical protein
MSKFKVHSPTLGSVIAFFGDRDSHEGLIPVRVAHGTVVETVSRCPQDPSSLVGYLNGVRYEFDAYNLRRSK